MLFHFSQWNGWCYFAVKKSHGTSCHLTVIMKWLVLFHLAVITQKPEKNGSFEEDSNQTRSSNLSQSEREIYRQRRGKVVICHCCPACLAFIVQRSRLLGVSSAVVIECCSLVKVLKTNGVPSAELQWHKVLLKCWGLTMCNPKLKAR